MLRTGDRVVFTIPHPAHQDKLGWTGTVIRRVGACVEVKWDNWSSAGPAVWRAERFTPYYPSSFDRALHTYLQRELHA